MVRSLIVVGAASVTVWPALMVALSVPDGTPAPPQVAALDQEPLWVLEKFVAKAGDDTANNNTSNSHRVDGRFISLCSRRA
jgi:hypothetical protein